MFKLLKSHGIPLQFSVFLVVCSGRDVALLEAKLAQCMNRHEDDVRLYRLPVGQHKVMLGQSLVVQDVLVGCGMDAWQLG